MLSLAGQPFTPLTSDLRTKVERWWREEAPDTWAWPGYSLEGLHHLPVPDRPKSERALLNVLYWPTGASRWAVFHGLMGDDGAAAVQAAAGSSAPVALMLLMKDEVSGNQVSTQMYLADVRAVLDADGASSPGLAGGSKSYRLWWLTLVDERFFWWTKNLTYTYSSSWASLLNNLVSAASGSSASVPSVPAAYGSASASRWQGLTQPLPLLIDAAARSVGFRFVRLLDGTLKYVTAVQAGVDDDARWDAYGGEAALGTQTATSEQIGSIPASVNVGFGSPPVVTNVTLASLSLPEYGAKTGVAGAAAWVFGDLPSSASGTARTNYATQAATDYYRWCLSVTDATFRNILPLTGPNGLEDRIEWEYQPGRRSFAGASGLPADVRLPPERLATRIVRADIGDRNLYGSVPSAECCLWGGGYYATLLQTNAGTGYATPGNPAPAFPARITGISYAGTGTFGAVNRTILDSLVIVPAGTGWATVRGSINAFARTATGLAFTHAAMTNGYSNFVVSAGVYQLDGSNNVVGTPLWYGRVCQGQFILAPEFFVGHVAASSARFASGDVSYYDAPSGGLYTLFEKGISVPDLQVYVGTGADLRLAWVVTIDKSVDSWDLDYQVGGMLMFGKHCCAPVAMDFPGSEGFPPSPGVNLAAVNANPVG